MSVSSSLAHGADPDFRVGTTLGVQERLGSYGISRRFIAPLLQRYFADRDPSQVRVLDVGCGLGFGVIALRELGYDAWGLEPGGRLHDADLAAVPYIFPEFTQDLPSRRPEVEKFDLIMSHGVIEHVGTTDGNAALIPEFRDVRENFIRSQLDLLRPGGLLVVCGPNRLFPFDFQHGDHRYGQLGPLKRHVPFLKHLTIPWHRGNHLASHADLRRIARRSGRQLEFPDIRQHNYSSLSQLRNRPALRALFRGYINTVSAVPLPARRLLETHTVFVCRLVS